MPRTKHDAAEERGVDANGVWWPRRRLKPGVTAANQEKREFERIPIQRRARAAELDGFGEPGAMFACTIVNVSRGGVGVCAPRMVHISRQVFIEIEGADKRCRLLFGTVRQVRYVEAQGYVFGIQFEAMPTSGPAVAWAARRRRRAGPRWRCSA